MKKIALILMAAAALFTACKKEGPTSGSGEPLMADFTISANPVAVGDEVIFSAKAEGGTAPYTFTWELGSEIKEEGQEVKYTFEKNGAYIIKLIIVDKEGQKAEKRKNLVVNPAAVAEKGEVKLLWAANIRGYNAVSSPAIADDGSVYAVSGSNKDLPGMIYKFDKDGKLFHTFDSGGINPSAMIFVD